MIQSKTVAIERGYLSLGHGQLHYRLCGMAGAPKLLMLHQAPSGSQMFVPLMHALSDRYHIFAPDLPGFGASDPLNTVSMKAFADAIANGLTQIGFGPCHLFGHHTGASVAVALAARHPDIVRKTALCGPPLLSQEVRASLPGKATYIPPDASGSHLIGIWKKLRGKDSSASLKLSMRELILALMSGERNVETYQAVADYDFAADLKRLDGEVLALAGEHDLLATSVSAVKAVRPETFTTIIEDAGTYVCDQNIPVLSEVLSAFFSD